MRSMIGMREHLKYSFVENGECIQEVISREVNDRGDKKYSS